MLKFIIPAIILFSIVLFWEKISETILQKFHVRVNYIILAVSLLILTAIFTLLYF